MFMTLVLLAHVFNTLEDIVANVAAATIEGVEYRHTTVSSEMILTPREQEAMASGSLGIKEQVALIRRGLIRQEAVAR